MIKAKQAKKIAGVTVRVIILALFLLVAVLPLFWIFVTSLKGAKELYAIPLIYWPENPTFDAYKRLFSYSNFGRYFLNSFKVTVIASVGAMVISILSGFALSRLKAVKAKGFLEVLMYFTQTIPSFMLMVPLFTMFSKMKLVDNHGTLIFVYIGTVVAFCTIMSRSFFDRIPASLEEAARIDGCNMLQSIDNAARYCGYLLLRLHQHLERALPFSHAHQQVIEVHGSRCPQLLHLEGRCQLGSDECGYRGRTPAHHDRVRHRPEIHCRRSYRRRRKGVIIWQKKYPTSFCIWESMTFPSGQ